MVTVGSGKVDGAAEVEIDHRGYRDGSQAAIVAALWGIDEALGRGASLRLVSVIKQTHPLPDDYARMDFSIGGEPNWNRRPVTVSGITRT
jgi:nucleotide-binding universal stress UspA family protein